MKALNIQNVGRARQQGFTIIELVVVILLLGILTATALPRFMDVTDAAHQAVFDGVQGGFGTGIALFHAQYIANGEPAAGTDVTGFGDGALETTATGYPSGDDTTGTAQAGVMAEDEHCLDVFNAVLQPGRPTIAINATGETLPTGVEIAAATTDFIASLASAPTCSFVYAGQRYTVSAPVLEYNSTTGAVSVGSSI